jgi:hypothetical protein
MRQLDQRSLEEAQAAENLRNSRKANKVYFDQHKRLCLESEQLKVGDLVLVLNAKYNPQVHAVKLHDRWIGPHRIREVAENSTFYRLAELDGTQLAASFTGNLVKKFFFSDRNWRRIVLVSSQLYKNGILFIGASF